MTVLSVEEEEKRRKESLSYANNEDAAVELLEEIRRISEDRFAAGWMIGIEYDLWLALEGKPYLVDGEDVLNLKAAEAWKLGVLHGRAGGWWRWVDEAGGPLFTRTWNWLRKVEAYERNTGR